MKPAKVVADVREVVRDPRRWHDLWGGAPPEVDFTTSMVLVAETRIVEHPKDFPRVWQVRRAEGKPGFTVLVRVRQVGGDFDNKAAGGSGFHFVEVPREDGPVHWRDVRVVYVEGEVDSLEVVKDYDQ